jgi:delta14-sterol reductase
LDDNTHFGDLDVKMWLYLVGATVCDINLFSFSAHQYKVLGYLPYNTMLYIALLLWFTLEYLWFEKPHLWTYDFFVEKTGFKLAWGCLTVYPFLYPIGAYAIVHDVCFPHQSPP